MRQNKRIVLTGGIGSGKSTVAKWIRDQGFPVISADEVYDDLLKEEELRSKLSQEFGEDIVQEGQVKKDLLKEKLREREDGLIRLNAITHPVIYKRLEEEADGARGPVVFLEIPLYYEGLREGFDVSHDEVWTVSAPVEKRIERAVLRGGQTGEEVAAFFEAQTDDVEREQMADLILDNSQDEEHLHRQLQEIFQARKWKQGKKSRRRKKVRRRKKEKKGCLGIFMTLLLAILLPLLLIFYFIFFFGAGNYSAKYTDLIKEYAEEYQLDEYLVVAVVHTESHFDPNAVSSADARGLMQLLPETAKWVCEKNDWPYEEDLLYEPEFNLRLGTYYLKYLLDSYQNEALALAAYNAGPGNVNGWLREGKISYERETLVNIPNKEPREYVNKVESAKKMYKRLYPEGLYDVTSPQWKTAFDFIGNIWTSLKRGF